MKRRLFLTVLITVLLGMSWGCGKERKGTETLKAAETLGGGGATKEKKKEKKDPEETPTDADRLLDGADLIGTVTEFSGDGCRLIPTHQEEAEGGGLAWSAAEGYEEEAEKITVSYGKDCSFQIAEVNILTAEASYKAASIEDVKKQTDLVLYGTYEEDGSLTAERVYIYRRTEG